MTATLTTWTELRDQTIDRFNGQTPRPEDEGPIIDAYEQHPTMVMRAIDEVADQLAENKITWAWSVLRSRLERGSQPVREATPQTGAEKTKRITNAERFIHNAGRHYDQPAVEDELFGERGLLKDYAKDDTLRARMLAVWQTESADHHDWCRHCDDPANTHASVRPQQPRSRTETPKAMSVPTFAPASAQNGSHDLDADKLPF